LECFGQRRTTRVAAGARNEAANAEAKVEMEEIEETANGRM
jgi:hypothetical protein